MTFSVPEHSYFEDRPVLHTAQGDFYEDVAIPVFIGERPDRARGARKRPLAFIKPEPVVAGLYTPKQRLVVVCTYTCNFVAQPPGSAGYSHLLRQVAPVVPIADLIGNRGMQKTEARKLKSGSPLSGLLYVPRPPGHQPAADAKFDDEFTQDDYAILLYGTATVHQSVLDNATRIARLSMQAQKLLIAGLIGVFSPSLYDPQGLEDPDMTCSWSATRL